jgi:hypothetical protein
MSREKSGICWLALGDFHPMILDEDGRPMSLCGWADSRLSKEVIDDFLMADRVHVFFDDILGSGLFQHSEDN